jgi:hypothetical protein
MESHRSSDFDTGSQELSFYALDIEKIDDLDKHLENKNPKNIKSLRVMHCNSLLSLKGIHSF